VRAVAVACAVLAVGCGSAGPEELPPAAGPERSPSPRERPAGRVITGGAAPERPYPHGEVRARGRLFVADERDHALRVVGSGRAAARVPTALGPRSLAVAEDGERVAVVAARERVLELFDARTLRRVGSAPAGVGPTNVASDGGSLLFVVDTEGDGLLLFRTRPRLELERRVALSGAPYAIAIDRVRRRLWVTVTARNRLVELTANGRPRPLRELPTVRQPDAVAVEERTGRVFVTGRPAGTLQIVDP
jgi:DNA-binding beta-propeller fold protein YncE